MRSVQRTRHQVSPRTMRALTPFFRQSHGREAYVLRGVGNHIGPVLRPRSASPAAPGQQKLH